MSSLIRIVVIGVAFFATLQSANAQSIIYVDDDASMGGNGASWASAFKDLQDALAIAGPGDEVWIAQGIYKPATVVDQLATFQLLSDVAIYGGFAGLGAAEPDARDILAFPTTLSGDLNGDDDGVVNITDNSYHVVNASGVASSAILDGFIIEAGNAGDAPENHGAGILCIQGSPTIRNCTIRDCRADSGAAMYIVGPSAAPTLMSCRIEANATTFGGAVSIATSPADLLLQSCVFTGNTQTGTGIGANGGGSIYVHGHSTTVRAIDCTFMREQADEGGGAISVKSGGRIELYSCEFLGNTTPLMINGNNGGAAIWLDASSPRTSLLAVNSLFIGNASGNSTGAIKVQDVVNCRLVNCAIVANHSDTATPGGIGGNDSNVALENCILWGNVGDLSNAFDMQRGGGGMTYTQAQTTIEGDSHPLNGLDPLFTSAPDPGPDLVWGTVDDFYGNLRLTAASPVINAGDALLLPSDALDFDLDGNLTEVIPFDLEGNPRIVGSEVDRGPYELITNCVTCPGLRQWLPDTDGLFDMITNWTLSVPEGQHTALLSKLFQDIVITFTSDVAHRQTIIEAGDWTFDLGGFTYTLTGGTETALIVGDTLSANTSLTIANGTVNAASVGIGFAQDSSGTITLADAGASLLVSDTLAVGFFGNGSLSLSGGAYAATNVLEIGSQPSSFGQLAVTGPATLMDTVIFSTVDHGVLDVSNGAIFNPGLGGVFVLDNGFITGDGTISGDVTNFGELTSGVQGGPLGQGMTITGDYVQLGQLQQAGVTGSLRVAIGGNQSTPTANALSVNNAASLAGGLVVAFDPPNFDPAIDASVDVLNAATRLGQFDVAFMPGLSGGKFLTVDYPTPQSVAVRVVDLAGGIDVDAAIPFSTPGVASDAALGDLDGDGDLDLAVTIPASAGNLGLVVVLYNDSAPGVPVFALSGSTQYTVGNNPTGLAIADFDGVPGLDIAVVNNADNNVTLLLNTNAVDPLVTPSFVADPSGPFPVGLAPLSIATGDIDGDMLPDIAVTNSGEDTVSVLLNAGAGALMLHSSPPVGAQPDPIILADLNGDLLLDLVVGNFNDATLSIFGNLGDPGTGWSGFASPIVAATAAGPIAIDSGDLDNDKDLDLAVACRSGDAVSIVLGNGDLTFEPRVDLPVGVQPRSLTLVDLDKDGDRDLAVVTGASGSAVAQLVRNDLLAGQLTFAPARIAQITGSPSHVRSGDVDGDTFDDLVTVNETVVRGAAQRGPGNDVSVALNALCFCPGDANASCSVDLNDLNLVLFNFGATVPAGTGGDVNDSGTVDLTDLNIVLFNFGMSC